MLKATMFNSLHDLKVHAYALARIIEKEPAWARQYAENLWSQSPSPTPEGAGATRVATPVDPRLGAVDGDWLRRAKASPLPPVSPDRSLPGFAATPEQTEQFTKALDNIANNFQQGLVNFGAQFAQRQKDQDDEAKDDADGDEEKTGGGRDKFHAIMSLDFKRRLPTIEDHDYDLDNYDMMFDSTIECYSHGGRKVTAMDKLHLYSSGFKDGSTRKRVYDNMFRKATRAKRLPKEAGLIMNELRAELRLYIKETKMQRQVRLDGEFDALSQGAMSHADFQTLCCPN